MKALAFREQGRGKTLFFIHGFPFNLKIWDGYVEKFIDQYHVVTIDLPGFGKSPVLPSPFSIDQVADALLSFLEHRELRDVVLIGHSLGGYVSLSMIKKNPTLFSSLILFHSTAYADSAEKKESRSKTAEFVQRNGALPFTSNFIHPLFVDQHHPGIEFVRKIANEAASEAVIGYSLAMRDRQEHIKTLERFENPTLFLAGKNDPGIPVESVLKQGSHCKKPEIHILEKVAHMGMFERADDTVAKIKGFLNKSDT
jgi:pimeloyl-ACP methyl ester carboxylesterase